MLMTLPPTDLTTFDHSPLTSPGMKVRCPKHQARSAKVFISELLAEPTLPNTAMFVLDSTRRL